MRYIDAGYAVALSTLAAYAVVLWRRWRRLEPRASTLSKRPEP
jgi:hypothetical protein